ncbi:MAG: hypothetical protein DHS20C02_06010 [Micavibrio sp.]|nr:MAG: hypothetical protein DHS20C02_06010 [Micavibrio sp.]
MRVAGASQFLNASTLANSRGIAPSAPTVLSQSGDTASLLEAGRNALRVGGFGISSGARALNAQYLSQSSSLGNQILSLAVGANATIEGAQQQILALRSRFSDDQLAPFLRAEESTAEDTLTGSLVDEEA